MIRPVPAMRVQVRNDAPVRSGRSYVLYWMIAARRTRYSYGLQRALWWAQQLKRPLVVLEALRVGYPWASDRIHRFVLDGMADNRRALTEAGIAVHSYVERAPGEGRGLLDALAQDACVVVTDRYPCFFLPRMVEAAAARLPVHLEAVDSNGILPLAAADRAFPTAHSFRRHLQKTLRPHLAAFPMPDPLAVAPFARGAALSPEIAQRWPDGVDVSCEALPIDHSVAPVSTRGGSAAGEAAAARFLRQRLDRYGDERNHPDAHAASGLSPYLHFGHLSAHQVVDAVLQQEDWDPERLAPTASGSRGGWWGLSPSAEGFLDELITWRELGYVFCDQVPDYDRYERLPDWALQTLAEHAADRRPHVYDLDTLDRAATHDPIWNAAQRQLREEGRIHNYLRMLWGKKILHWTPGPRDALAVMIELNNRYALDGRDPNSYSGIFWVLGRFDRAWGPERPIFGKVRYMTSDSTRRKLRLSGYLERWGA
ncbi:MAG: deoxyribodipyrimidine photolyase [Alphaproteobacteria bacterium]|nr:deoxyribodipyrimidine photolyase [Alphaproteobacteria bacterium]